MSKKFTHKTINLYRLTSINLDNFLLQILGVQNVLVLLPVNTWKRYKQ